MTKENILKIETTKKNDKSYDNIDLSKMQDGESVVVKKLSDLTNRVAKKGTAFDKDKEWTMCNATVEYQGKKVGFFLPRGYGIVDGNTAYIENTTYADMFDKAGVTGDSVRITCKKGLGVDKKQKDIAVRNYSFEKVQ